MRYLLYAMDVVAILVLVLGLYFPRHRRKDLVVAYLGVNVGVLAVASALEAGTVAAGLGLGLFGVLSIIRLRSTELSQTEVAYYFSALALGLLGAVSTGEPWLAAGGTVLVLVVMAFADASRFLGRHRSKTILVDRAFLDETALANHLERLLGCQVTKVSVQRVDLVNDTTAVEVRYVVPDRTEVEGAGTLQAGIAHPGAAPQVGGPRGWASR